MTENYCDKTNSVCSKCEELQEEIERLKTKITAFWPVQKRQKSRDFSKPLKCLLVDDDVATTMILNSIFKEYGECSSSHDGLDAWFQYMTAIQSNEPFDLICVDIGIPKLDGQEVVKEIRAYEEKHNIKNKIKAIMITGNDGDDEILKAFETVDAYFVKPISKTKLIKKCKDFGLIRRNDEKS